MKLVRARSMAEKKEFLRRRLEEYGRLLVAFSGGKDSLFLWQEASEILGASQVFPYFIRTPFTLDSARERVAYFRNKFSMPVNEISIDFLKDSRLRRNPRQRCYLCKIKMFTALKNEARKLGIRTIADGTTASDLGEHRPGRLALEKLAVRSPLRDAGFSSAELVSLLKKKGVAAYFLTSSTCLATRFPYDFSLNRRLLEAVGRVEHYLADHGVYPVRVRHMTDGVRIETTPANFVKVIALRAGLSAVCRAAGFHFTTLDLGGLQSGCWDELPEATVPARKMVSKC